MLPIITIARQYGSGGHEVGEKISDILNLPFYDKALIALAAKKSGFSEEVFAEVDERATSSLLYSMVMGSFAYGGHVAGLSEMPINDKLFVIQSNIIQKAADEGPCVIIGRCADYILHDRKDLLRVFIHADKDTRVKRVVEKGIVEESRASDFVTKADKRRSNYYNFYSNNKWDDLQNYDLTINTAVFDVDSAAEMIIQAAKILDK
jgi:Cytidylate kinase